MEQVGAAHPQSARGGLATSPAAILVSRYNIGEHNDLALWWPLWPGLADRGEADLQACRESSCAVPLPRYRRAGLPSTHAHVAEPDILRPMHELMNRPRHCRVKPEIQAGRRRCEPNGAELTETIDGEHMQTRSAQPRRHPALAMKAACYVGRRPGQFHQRVRQAPVLQRLRPSAETPI